jgi:hypothetical protein
MLEVFLGREEAETLVRDDLALIPGCLQVADDFAKPNTPMAMTTKSMPSVSGGMSKAEARNAGIHVGADQAEQQAQHDHGEGLEQRTRSQHHGADQAQHHQREVFGGAELEGQLGQRRREGGQDQRRDAAGEEGAEAGRGQRDARRRPFRAIW